MSCPHGNHESECDRCQELDAAHARGKIAAVDCRTCRRAWTRDGYEYGCKSLATCTDGDRYVALPPVRLYRSNVSNEGR